MLFNATHFLLTTLFNLFTFVLLLRFFMQWLRASFQNPLAQMTIALTDFLVKPARKWVPSWKKLDLSTLVLAFIVQFLLMLFINILRGVPFAVAGPSLWINMCLLAILAVLKISLDIFFYAILIQAILSWVNPHTPISGVLETLTRPILSPLRRWVPPVNGFDFSALIALILLQMVNIALIPSIESSLKSVF
jgi:YggT family protein